MKADVKKLKARFSFTKPKIGELVITAEIQRVIGYTPTGNLRVVDVFPDDCTPCKKRHHLKECCHEHIMDYGAGGQQKVMKLK